MLDQPDRLSRRLVFGRANQIDPEVLERATTPSDPLLLSRKGQLCLLAAPWVESAILEGVRDRYYAGSSLDILPSLQAALSWAYAEHPALRVALPLAVVLVETELYALGNECARLWLVHLEEVRQLLVPLEEDSSLASARRRLSIADVVVMATDTIEPGLSAGRLRRLARRSGPAGCARSLARSAPRREAAPVTVFQMSGFTPIAALGKVAAPRVSEAAPPRTREGPSPIWTALLVAVIAVGVTLWIKRPSLSEESLASLVTWMLTPVPSPSPEGAAGSVQAPTVSMSAAPESVGELEPTATPTRVPTRVGSTGEDVATEPPASPTPDVSPSPKVYPMPRLLSPAEGEDVSKTYLTLQWEWDGELAEDEYFDVRLWRIGTDEQGIAWTKKPQYVERSMQAGWHSWTVVVIRGREGVVLEEMSAEPPAVDFFWHGKGSSAPRATVLPTRNAPAGQPTRTTPDSGD